MFKKGDKIISFSQYFGIEVLAAGEIVEITEPETTMDRLVGGVRTYKVKMTPEAKAILPPSAKNDGFWDVQETAYDTALYTAELWLTCARLYNSRQRHFLSADNDRMLIRRALIGGE